jgi:hypothetical protein
MGERMGQIGRISTDFLGFKCWHFKQKNEKKSVEICPIRPIRFPIVSQFSKAEMPTSFTI